MIEDFQRDPGVLFDECEQLGVPRFDKLAIKRRVDQAAILAGRVIRLGDDHDVGPDQFQGTLPIGHLHLHDDVQEGFGELLVG